MPFRNAAVIAANILRTPTLRNIFILCLAISVLLPTYSTFFVMPSFSDELTRDTEDNARRTAAHLASLLSLHSGALTRKAFSPEIIRGIEQSREDLQLEKIKVFSNSGEIIYSSDARDVGTMNQKSYFREIIAKGRIFSLIVSKNGKTAENRVVDRDVAEVYIPIMRDNEFKGAFEIYYDITARKQNLSGLLKQSSTILYTIAVILLLSVVVMLLKASENAVHRVKAEEALQESHNRLQGLVTEQVREILVTQKTSVEALAILAEYYDCDTGEHLIRIQEYVDLLASWLQKNSPYAAYIGKKREYISEIRLASLLHDIGKIAISREILTKPGKLTSEEFAEIQKHTLIAGEVLNRANAAFVKSFGKDSYLALARAIALNHHEKWDGSGYPMGLKGEAIPLSARIVALADVYDALRSRRSYKEAFAHMDSVNIIARERGKHFDPYVVKAFLAQADKFYEISSRAGRIRQAVVVPAANLCVDADVRKARLVEDEEDPGEIIPAGKKTPAGRLWLPAA